MNQQDLDKALQLDYIVRFDKTPDIRVGLKNTTLWGAAFKDVDLAWADLEETILENN